MGKYKAYAPVFKALGDETRLSILEMLLEKGEMCACRIQDAFQCTQPTISYHMRVLTETGLVEGRRDVCLICYRVAPGVEKALGSFLNALDTLGAKEESSFE